MSAVPLNFPMFHTLPQLSLRIGQLCWRDPGNQLAPPEADLLLGHGLST